MIRLACALLISLSLSIGAEPARASPPAPRPFYFRLAGDPETFDWNRANTLLERYIIGNIMEGLLTFDDHFKIVPELAERMELSRDGKTYIFHLRAGVKWSDGVPLRAQDFVYSWKRLLSPITGSTYAYFLFDVEGAEDFYNGKVQDFSKVGVQAADDRTLVVKLREPVPFFPQLVTFWVTYPLRQDVVEKYGPGWEKPGRTVTLGPYLLESHDLDSKIVLRANPLYHGTRGNVEQAIGLIVRDSSTALNLFDSGKLDFLFGISTSELKRVQGRPEYRVLPLLRTYYLGFVVGRFPMGSAKVRRALAMGIDKGKVPELFLQPHKAASSFVPAALLPEDPSIGLPFDPAAAKRELQSAGFDLARLPHLELLTANLDVNLMLAQFVQQQLSKNLGFEVEIQTFDPRAINPQLDLKAYPMFTYSWGADFPDADNFMSVFLGASGNNRTGWKNARYDEIVLKARHLADAKARQKAYAEAQKLLINDEAVMVPLFYDSSAGLVRSSVKGVVTNAFNYVLFRRVILEK